MQFVRGRFDDVASAAGSRSERLFAVLAGLFVAACVVGALIDLVLGSREDWGAVVLLSAAAVLVLGSLYAFRADRPWIGVVLIVPGAIAGAMGLVWTALVPIVGLTLIVLAVRQALGSRQRGAAPSEAQA